MLLLVVCLSSVLFASCHSEPANKGTDSACLVETYNVYTGNNRASYEFTISNKTVSATVDYYYNAPTGDKSTSGSLASIFEEVTGTLPATPTDYQTMESILPVLEENGWVVIDDTKRDNSDGSAIQSTIRTVNLRRKTRDNNALNTKPR